MFYYTCSHVGPVTLYTGTGVILAEHAYIVGLSTLQMDQITMGFSVYTFSAVASVCCNTHCKIGKRSAGPLPSHCSSV